MQLVALFGSILVSAATVVGQCSDPLPPRDGFRIKVDAAQLITFSDGYKTLADFYYPRVAAGRCGWPVVVFVHGLTANRSSATEAINLARKGYLAIAYDVRGQGAGRTLNPTRGSKLWALDEWIDLAEIIEQAETRFGALMDADRVGVFGDSQGGAHAWAAAAYSERKLPTNTRRTTAFPKIACVVPRFFAPSLVDVMTPGKVAFHWHLAGLAYTTGSNVLRLDKDYRAKLTEFLKNDDPEGLARYLATVPGKAFNTELQQSKVPMLAIDSWRDPWTDTREITELFSKLPQETPRRLYLTTGMHGTPPNLNQSKRQIALTQSWFDRFLKNGAEVVERGPTLLFASIPADGKEYAESKSIWQHRASSSWPPIDVRSVRYYLRANQRLSRSEPTSQEAPELIQHAVATGFDAKAYHNLSGKVSSVLAKIPLSDFSYETDPLTEAAEYTGSPVVRLSVTPRQSVSAIAARLLAVSPSDETQLLTTGSSTVRGVRPQQLQIELAPVAVIVPKGYKLRLELRNHDIIRPLNADSFAKLPVFESYEISIRHDKTDQSWLTLPKRRFVQIDFSAERDTISTLTPQPLRLSVRSAPSWAGSIYLIAASMTGQGPVQRLPSGSEMWLTTDTATMEFTAAINNAVLSGFAGNLDNRGEATATLDLGHITPLPKQLAGLNLHFVPLLYNQARSWHAGPPVRLRFQ